MQLNAALRTHRGKQVRSVSSMKSLHSCHSEILVPARHLPDFPCFAPPVRRAPPSSEPRMSTTAAASRNRGEDRMLRASASSTSAAGITYFALMNPGPQVSLQYCSLARDRTGATPVPSRPISPAPRLTCGCCLIYAIETTLLSLARSPT
jgi:hypothetical protein